MTLRSFASLTLAAVLILLGMVALGQMQASQAMGPGSNVGDPALIDRLLTSVPAPPAAVESDGIVGAPTGTTSTTTTTTTTMAPLPLPTLAAVVAVEPPALIELPADLVATPVPSSSDEPPLPFLTNIAPVPRDGSVVYLTFDDGPDPIYTNQILDVLARYDATATFFVLGRLVDEHPEVVQRMVAEGHTIGNHTYFHEALPNESADSVRHTLDATSGAIARAIGRTSGCMRPPYGAMDQATFEQVTAMGFTVHMWEVDSEDWRVSDSYTIAASVLSATSLGDRVLFHDGPTDRAATVAAVDSVLNVLTNRGVHFQALDC